MKAPLRVLAQLICSLHVLQAYGYAGDNIIQAQVVLVDGTIVIATKQNQYSDLFWAINGGNGQFGIVTR